jgi:hypothetical protein
MKLRGLRAQEPFDGFRRYAKICRNYCLGWFDLI